MMVLRSSGLEERDVRYWLEIQSDLGYVGLEGVGGSRSCSADDVWLGSCQGEASFGSGFAYSRYTGGGLRWRRDPGGFERT